MSPIQQMLLGVGAVATKTYVDDIFSTYVYEGNGDWSTPTPPLQTINTGLNMSGEGGLLWIKQRDGTGSSNHILFDTVRGVNKNLKSDSNAAEVTAAGWNQTFTSTGFTLNNSFNETNADGETYASWSFRKAPGFFDVVTYTGNGSNRTIAHSLGSVPGMIMVKRTDTATDWRVLYRGSDGDDTLKLNNGGAAVQSPSSWNSTLPTATHFSLGTQTETNDASGTFIAYVFAGGESTAATARSVEFDGSGDYLLTSSSGDYTMGTGDFTVEGWFKTESYDKVFLAITDSSSGFSTTAANITLWVSSAGDYTFNAGNGEKSTTVKATKNQWEHLAYVRHNGTTSLYVNGTFAGSKADTHNYNGTYVNVGAGYNSGFCYDGKISNFRVVKGTAVYTSSFTPPTEPLANITNTVLLCCQSSTAAGATVHAGGLTANGNPTAETDHPFDDPAGFVFGESGSESVIKCGSYVGNGNADGPEIFCGWEPQLVFQKKASDVGNWHIMDSMRGVISGSADAYINPNRDAAEHDVELLDFTPTGFKNTSSRDSWNANGGEYIWMAIRRPDGYVGKPPELGTSVFAMDTGAGSSTTPNYDSGFPVDFALLKAPAAGTDWYAGARLVQGTYLRTNATSSSTNWSAQFYDSNVGYAKDGSDSAWQSWMWKRHAGFDVVAYKGDGVAGHQISHSLSKTPEMIWTKRRDSTGGWFVYHKGLDGGNQPETHYLYLNLSDAEGDQVLVWNDTAPTSSQFTVGSHLDINANNGDYMAMLFASVDGISKVGYYDGSDSAQTITTGFQPRFVIIKNYEQQAHWYVLDTTRGWASGNDQYLELDTTDAQVGTVDFGAPTSTGFTLTGGNPAFNESAKSFIYYAHA